MSNHQNLSDEELVQICKCKGLESDAAFREIVRRYKDYIYSTAFKKLNNSDDALDATQETFIRIFHGLGNFRFDSSFRTWISVITANVCLTMVLTEKRKFWKYHVSLEGDADLDNIYASLISEQQEINFWKKVGEILRQMYKLYRKVFILKYFKDYSLQALAEKISATIAAVKMKVKRAKDQFIKIFIRG